MAEPREYLRAASGSTTGPRDYLQAAAGGVLAREHREGVTITCYCGPGRAPPWWRRLWNVVTCPLVYVVTGTFRL